MSYDSRVDRRRSIRWPGKNYGEPGAYFVTICTRNRECFLSDTVLAEIVTNVWHDVVGFGLGECEFVVMPNHVHGIVWVSGDLGDAGGRGAATEVSDNETLNEVERASDCNGAVAAPLRLRRFGEGTEPGTLATIVRTFKAASAKRINNLRGTPGMAVWQRNYYERVVRNDEELYAIRQYILDNPAKWDQDKHNPAVFSRRVGAQQPHHPISDRFVAQDER